ncbi:MAG: hypothetical protein F6K18_24165 [Okeania sp. SIO2C2]|uniref:hypothetical protein n=1 Tax=Okeania sp. SIO2C2 TaxID=2607787 RepID=UPI0013BB0432|nr:hypothetical protein [Okeania sp. SIO2C2]NEP89675.1 hypothetical protein [Okeania sp. SIO2C2]
MNENIVSVENVIKQIDGMNLEQQLELIAYIANKIQKYKSSPNKKNSLKSIIGSGKGCFATPEEVDNFINQERDKWEF